MALTPQEQTELKEFELNNLSDQEKAQREAKARHNQRRDSRNLRQHKRR